MLVLLPPSEGKEYPDDDAPAVDLHTLTLPGLAAARAEVLESLVELSAQEDAQQILKVGKSVLPEVHANTGLRDAPAVPAWQVYSGVLFDALGAASLSAAQLQRAGESVFVFSGLFGLTGFADRIPAYRCAMDVKLPGVGNLGTFWKRQLTDRFAEVAGDHLLVDCRSGSYQRAFPGDPQYRLEINSFTEQDGVRKVITHFAKATRGELAGMLLRAQRWPQSIEDVAEIAAQRWRVELRPAQGKKSHQLDLISTL